jgi:hypothetical protein
MFLIQTIPAAYNNNLGLSSILKVATDLSQLAVANYPSLNILKSNPTTNSV